jgi:hypothetical protein
MQIRRLVAAAAVPLLLAAVGCSDKDKEKNKQAAGKSCDGLLKSADASAALPGEIPAGVDGATFYEKSVQGKTTQYFAYVSASDLVATRDKIKAAYEGKGINVKGTDQEVGAEAELEFEQGGNEGSVQVIPLCKDTVRLRYRVGPK